MEVMLFLPSEFYYIFRNLSSMDSKLFENNKQIIFPADLLLFSALLEYLISENRHLRIARIQYHWLSFFIAGTEI